MKKLLIIEEECYINLFFNNLAFIMKRVWGSGDTPRYHFCFKKSRYHCRVNDNVFRF